MEDGGQLGTGASGEGMLLQIPVLISSAQLGLEQLSLVPDPSPAGPWGKGTVNNLMVKVLAVVAGT